MESSEYNIDISRFLKDDCQLSDHKSCWQARVRMLRDGLYADITIRTIGGESVKAHRLMLGRMSSKLQIRLRNMPEQMTFLSQIWSEVEALQLFLLLLYSKGKVQVKDAFLDKYCLELIEACHEYQVPMQPRLGPILAATMARLLTVENCWSYYMRLLKYCDVRGQPNEVMDVIIKHMFNNFPQFVDSNAFCATCKKYPGATAAVTRWWTRAVIRKIGDGSQLPRIQELPPEQTSAANAKLEVFQNGSNDHD